MTTPRTHGTLESTRGRPTLRFARTFDYPLLRVWQAVSTPTELERWFPAAVDWTPAPGEIFQAGGATLEVTEVDAPHVLAWVYAGQPHRFELSQQADGCRLVFVHVTDDPALTAQTATGWETYLSRLEPHLAGEHVPEDVAHESWSATHEQYAARFGVDPAPGRRFAENLKTGEC